jgi:hypothetical protein
VPRSPRALSPEPHSMRGRATMRDLSVFARWFGLQNTEFLLPWRSISAEQPGRAGHEGDTTGAHP